MESSYQDRSTIQKRVMDALENRDVIKGKVHEVKKSLKELDSHKIALLDILRMYYNGKGAVIDRYKAPRAVSQCKTAWMCPFQVSGERYLLKIYNLGRLPTSSMKAFYNNRYIYPIDYMCKRAYYGHGSSSNNVNEILLYNCTIRSSGGKPMFEISEGSRLCVRGKATDVFNVFRGLFKTSIGFSNIQDFFGLGNPEVRKLLSNQEGFESLDISINAVKNG